MLQIFQSSSYNHCRILWSLKFKLISSEVKFFMRFKCSKTFEKSNLLSISCAYFYWKMFEQNFRIVWDNISWNTYVRQNIFLIHCFSFNRSSLKVLINTEKSGKIEWFSLVKKWNMYLPKLEEPSASSLYFLFLPSFLSQNVPGPLFLQRSIWWYREARRAFQGSLQLPYSFLKKNIF